MKIIQTYWTTDKDKNPFESCGGVLSPVVHWMMWGLSCAKFKEHYGDVVLYTDTLGKQVFEEFGIPFSRIIVSHEKGFMQRVDPKLWAYAKIYTYSLQSEPFLHVDGDVVIWDKLPKRIEKAQVAAQCLEYNWPIYRECVEDFKHLSKRPGPEWVDWGEKNPSGYNMGIFGGSDIPFIQDYCKKAFDFYIEHGEELSSLIKINRNTNVLPEQYLLYADVLKQRKKVSMLSKKPMDTPLQLSAHTNIFEIPAKSKFFHAIGGAKKSSLVNDFVSYVLKKEYPALWEKIVSVCNMQVKQANAYYFGLENSQADYDYVEHVQATKTLREIAAHSKFDCSSALDEYADLVKRQERFRKKHGRKISAPIPFPSYSLQGVDLSKWKYRDKFIILSPDIEVFKTNYEWRKIFMETNFGNNGPVPHLMGDLNYRNAHTGSWNHFWVDEFLWSIVEELQSKPYTIRGFVKTSTDSIKSRKILYTLLNIWYKNGLLTVADNADDFVPKVSQDYETLQTNRRLQVSNIASYILKHNGIAVKPMDIPLKTDSNGTVSLQAMIDCLSGYGLQAKGVKAEVQSLEKLPLPAITLVKFRQMPEQYAVIVSVSDYYIIVFNSETMQEERYPIEDFQKMWDGIMILVQ